MLLLEELFGHSHMGKKVGIDFSEGLIKSQQVKLAKLRSQDDEHARMLGPSSSS